MIYPVHHLPQGQALDDQYLGLLNDLTDLLNRADQGKKNVKLADFLAHVRAFLRFGVRASLVT